MKNVIIFMPTLTAGGAEKVASLIANNWVDYPQIKVIIILLFKDEIFFKISDKIIIECIGIEPKLKRIKKLSVLFHAFWLTRSIIKNKNPIFVLSMMNKYNIFCIFSLLGTKIPIIVSERDSPLAKVPYITKILRKFSYRFAKGAIAQTKVGKAFIKRESGLENVIALPNPLKISSDQYIRQPQNIILNIGRLVNEKGQADLLKAFASLEKDDWTLVICGDGYLRKELELLAEKLAIHTKVKFLGTVSDVNYWLSKASIFAFTSYYEGFPNALAEAMIMGVPVISYDCPTGPSEIIIHGENGFLVPVGDIKLFAEHLNILTENSNIRENFGTNSKKVAKRLDAKIVAKEYFDFCTSGAK